MVLKNKARTVTHMDTTDLPENGTNDPKGTPSSKRKNTPLAPDRSPSSWSNRSHILPWPGIGLFTGLPVAAKPLKEEDALFPDHSSPSGILASSHDDTETDDVYETEENLTEETDFEAATEPLWAGLPLAIFDTAILDGGFPEEDFS